MARAMSQTMQIANAHFPVLSISPIRPLPSPLHLLSRSEMSTFSKKFTGKWTGYGARLIISAVTYIIFLFLDFLDKILCVVYRFLDEFIEGNGSSCYCEKEEEVETRALESEEGEVSETLYGRGRTNFFREMGFLSSGRKWEETKKNCGGFGSAVNRWSDCGCASCVSWQNKGDHKKLHVVVAEPSGGTIMA